MNILILTGKFGMGHYSAAKTLGLEIQKLFSSANVTIVDLVEYRDSATMPTVLCRSRWRWRTPSAAPSTSCR